MAADLARVRPRRARLRRASLLLVALTAAAACDAPTATPTEPGYDPTSLTGGLVYHWSPGATINVYADTTGFALAPGFDIKGAVGNAARVWRDAVYYREVDLRLASSPADADIIIHRRSVPRLVNTVVGGSDCDLDPVGVGGYTLFCPDTGNALVLPLLSGAGAGHVKVDIFVEPLVIGDAYLAQRGVTRNEAFYSLVAHELGHALGIGGHSQEPDDLMFGAPTAPRPTRRDAAALRFVLHQRADIRF